MTAAADLDGQVVAAMAALLVHRKDEPVVLAAKRAALSAVARSGVPKRRVSEHVCALLQARGWSGEDIDRVGVSAPQVRTDLERAPAPLYVRSNQ